MLRLGFKRIHQDLKMPPSCSGNVGLEKTMAATEFREEPWSFLVFAGANIKSCAGTNGALRRKLLKSLIWMRSFRRSCEFGRWQ